MTSPTGSIRKVPRTSLRLRVLGALTMTLLAALVACGSDASPTESTADPALAPFVGTWIATTFVHTDRDTPSTIIDLVADGASFTLTISQSGQYVGTIQVATESRTETGTLRVVGSQLVIQPVSPPSAEERVTFVVGSNSMTWTGLSEYDFNSDGIPSPTNVRIEFSKS